MFSVQMGLITLKQLYMRELVECCHFHMYGTRIKKVNVLRAYYAYGYGRTTPTATGVLRLRLRAYDAYGYGRTWSKATCVLGLRLRAYLV